MADSVDADHDAEVSGPAGLNAGQRVLEHRSLIRRYRKQLGRTEKRVRLGLAGDVFVAHRDAVDAVLDELGEPGDFEDVTGVGARRHHRDTQPGLTDCLEVSPGTVEY